MCQPNCTWTRCACIFSAIAQLYVCLYIRCLSLCVWWLSWELSEQMGVWLFLNEFNYRDGTVHQNWAPSRAPDSSVAVEIWSLLLLLHVFTESNVDPKNVKDLCLGTGGRQELGALLRRIQLSCGAKKLDGSTAKTNFFIFYAVQTELVQHSLSVALSSEPRRVISVSHGAIFPGYISQTVAMATSTLCILFFFFVNPAVGEVCSHSDRLPKWLIIKASFRTFARVSQ